MIENEFKLTLKIHTQNTNNNWNKNKNKNLLIKRNKILSDVDSDLNQKRPQN